MAGGGFGDLFGGAFGYDLAAAVSALGAHVDEPVGAFYDLEVVLDDDERVAGVAEFEQDFEELVDVCKVQAGGGLIEDVYGAARRLF